MIKEIGSRAAQMFLVFWLFVTLLFFLLHLAPGDITAHFTLDPNIPPETRRMLIERLGLDRPLHEQYLFYMRNLARGEFGISFLFYPRSVSSVLVERLPRTIMLFTGATFVSYWLGFASGKVLAWRRGGMIEYTTTVVGVLLYTVFVPWFAILMIWLFSFRLGWFPIRGFLTPAVWTGAGFTANQVIIRMLVVASIAIAAGLTLKWSLKKIDSFWLRKAAGYGGGLLILAAFFGYWRLSPMRTLAANIAWHSMLPTLTLTLISFAGVMLLTRSSLLETLREDYILTARAKGLPEAVVRDRHAARNALLPVVTTLVLSVAFIISGGIITERIFAWPGMGDALLQAAVMGDVPLAVGAFALIGVMALLAHIVVDVLYTYLDPRIRY